jgi:hypothetical protein
VSRGALPTSRARAEHGFKTAFHFRSESFYSMHYLATNASREEALRPSDIASTRREDLGRDRTGIRGYA